MVGPDGFKGWPPCWRRATLFLALPNSGVVRQGKSKCFVPLLIFFFTTYILFSKESCEFQPSTFLNNYEEMIAFAERSMFISRADVLLMEMQFLFGFQTPSMISRSDSCTLLSKF